MFEHGVFCWNELNTHDPDTAREFYEKAVGWRFEAMPMPEGDYLIAKMGDKPIGGVFDMRNADCKDVPPHWMSYLAVDDIDARCAAAVALGAKIHRGPWDIPGVGRIAIVQDAVGAIMGWMTPNPSCEAP
ncbi:MAG TPA: VOC family protein [Rhodospirillaceae bacterium]|nr:VOC family protein [Rhodospirillaceae bacterium]